MGEMQEIMETVLIGMQKRYRELLEVERLTKELADLLSAGDRESVQLLLNMRQRELEKVQQEDMMLRELLSALNGEKRTYLAALMNGKELEMQGSVMEQKISQLAAQMKSTLDRTITVDQVLSKKLAGKDSYYQ